jgi:hypothetical protein
MLLLHCHTTNPILEVQQYPCSWKTLNQQQQQLEQAQATEESAAADMMRILSVPNHSSCNKTSSSSTKEKPYQLQNQNSLLC